MNKSTKHVIVHPTKVVRQHIGFNPATGEMEFENLPPTWIAFFKKAGITKKDLQDKTKRDEVFKIMAKSSVVTDMEKQVSKDPKKARALRQSVRMSKVPPGMNVTPISPAFIKQQQEKEMRRTLSSANTSKSAKTAKTTKAVKTTQSYNQTPKKSVKKMTSNSSGNAGVGKLNIPKVFTQEEETKPMTYYEKLEMRQNEKPKTSNINNSSTLVKPSTGNKSTVKKATTTTPSNQQNKFNQSQNTGIKASQTTILSTKPKFQLIEDYEEEDRFKPIVEEEWSDDENPYLQHKQTKTVTKQSTYTPPKQVNKQVTKQSTYTPPTPVNKQVTKSVTKQSTYTPPTPVNKQVTKTVTKQTTTSYQSPSKVSKVASLTASYTKQSQQPTQQSQPIKPSPMPSKPIPPVPPKKSPPPQIQTPSKQVVKKAVVTTPISPPT